MTPEQIAQILDDLGQRLGPAGQHVFELAVRQVIAESIVFGIIEAVVLTILTVVAVAGARAVLRETRKPRSYGDTDMYWFFGGLGGIFYLFVAGGLTHDVASHVIALLNPEYAALRQILAAINPAK